jgi:hypothetical protein
MSGAPYGVRQFCLYIYIFRFKAKKPRYFLLSFALSEYERRTLACVLRTHDMQLVAHVLLRNMQSQDFRFKYTVDPHIYKKLFSIHFAILYRMVPVYRGGVKVYS